MKRLFVIFMLSVCSVVLADSDYHFIAKIDTDELIKSFGPNDKTYPLYKKFVAPDGTEREYYNVVVTEAQYNAGWSALDPAVKTAAKAAAIQEASDLESIDKITKALALVLNDYCNALQAGTHTQKTPAQLKADVITKYNALP